MVFKESWHENDILNLPLEENSDSERKSGKLFDDRNEFEKTVSKAISAFSNSGGGHLILGIDDEGKPDGLPENVGRTSMKDWLEQKIPHLVDYQIRDFRVHTVIKSTQTKIPENKVVIVIDIGDSALAPHQALDKKYYYRVAGRSDPAPHFYLELLHQRYKSPTLDYDLDKIEIIEASEIEKGMFIVLQLNYLIKNSGRIAAYKWALFPREIKYSCKGCNDDYILNRSNFPTNKFRSSGIPFGDNTILPGGLFRKEILMGVILRPSSNNRNDIKEELINMLKDFELRSQLATETSPGEISIHSIFDKLDIEQIANYILDQIKHK